MMKKRNKRRVDYDKAQAIKAQGKKVDDKLAELVEQYDALNETLKLELPKLSSKTEIIARICLTQFVFIQTEWHQLWQQKINESNVLEPSQVPQNVTDILDTFNRDFPFFQARTQDLSICNGAFLADTAKNRLSQTISREEEVPKQAKSRPPTLNGRTRGWSVHSDTSPSLPTPDFVKRNSGGQFQFSPILPLAPGLPPLSFHDSYPSEQSEAGPTSPTAHDLNFDSRAYSTGGQRPSSGRSYDAGFPRQSNESADVNRFMSGSNYHTSDYRTEVASSSRPFSGLFHSALPMSDNAEDSQKSSRASSRDRDRSDGYNVLYLAASLFEFNIDDTKSEAGFPYLTYQAGEVC
jgi:hypothetical protein